MPQARQISRTDFTGLIAAPHWSGTKHTSSKESSEWATEASSGHEPAHRTEGQKSDMTDSCRGWTIGTTAIECTCHVEEHVNKVSLFLYWHQPPDGSEQFPARNRPPAEGPSSRRGGAARGPLARTATAAPRPPQPMVGGAENQVSGSVVS